jgi:hypothetical protein
MVYRKNNTNIFCIIYFLILLIPFIYFHNIGSIVHASSSIIINEIMYDPTGSDTGYEWIELYNPLSTPVVLTGWKIQIAGTTFTDSSVLGEGTISSQSYYLICESKVEGCDMYVSKIAMQNGGDATDGVQILDSKGNVVDTVLYDTPNKNSLTKENGTVALDSETATPSGSGKSIGRKNMIDTDNSYNDFYVFDIPTPGEDNPTSTVLVPTGQFPILILLLLLFILLTYSDRLNHYSLNLISRFNATNNKNKANNS